MVELYDKVQGTSLDSRYLVIATTAKFRVSARVRDGSFSFRCETHDGSPIPTSDKERLVELGFHEKSKDNYVSFHVGYASDIEALKVFGALWYSFHAYYPTSGVIPDYWLIKDKGV